MRKIETDVLILGGGWSGLAAADLLKRQGVGVAVVEKENFLGGLARTETFNGFCFDIGGHRLSFRNVDNAAYFQSFFDGRELLDIPRVSKIFFDGTYFDYPLTPASVVIINKRHFWRIVADLLFARRKAVSGNFEEWVIGHYGETLYRIFFKEYTEKVWGVPCDKLSSLWACNRVGGGGALRLLKNLLMNEGGTVEGVSHFKYPRHGMAALIDALTARFEPGADLFRGADIQGFTVDGSRLKSVVFQDQGQPLEISFKKVISTIPLAELLRVLPDFEKKDIFVHQRPVRYRSLVLVSVVVKKEHVARWHWCYFPSKNTIFSRLHEPKFWSSDMSPSSDRTLVCAEIFCDYNDACWQTEDRVLFERVVSGLKSENLVSQDDIPGEYCVRRIQYAYPLHYCGFEKDLDSLKKSLACFSNLSLAGRSGAHAYYDMEECLNHVRSVIQDAGGV
ncbi:MAG: FAD-dependent oxidoreductase [Candidatus Omnitrophota bacterium]